MGDIYSENSSDSEQIERAQLFAADAQLCSELIQNKFKKE